MEDRDRKNVREEKSRKDRLMVPGDAAVVKGDKCRQSEVRFFSDSVKKKVSFADKSEVKTLTYDNNDDNAFVKNSQNIGRRGSTEDPTRKRQLRNEGINMMRTSATSKEKFKIAADAATVKCDKRMRRYMQDLEICEALSSTEAETKICKGMDIEQNNHNNAKKVYE